MPESVTIKREVILRAIVTEGLKEQLDQEFTEAVEQIDRRITQLDIGARQYVTELQRTDIQQAMAVRQQIEAEKRRYRGAKDELIQRQRAVAALEIGAEVIRGTLESQAEVRVGDNLATALRGVEIVLRAIEEPVRQIAANAGVEGSIVVERVRESKDVNFGYNAQTDTYEDLVEAGVIDPTKVTRTALQNAASIASLLLTTECVVVEKKEEEKAPAMPGGGMGGMY